MKASRVGWLLLLLILPVPVAHADGTNPLTVTFMGVNGVNDGHFYVTPYYAMIGTTSVPLYCDDLLNEASNAVASVLILKKTICP